MLPPVDSVWLLNAPESHPPPDSLDRVLSPLLCGDKAAGPPGAPRPPTGEEDDDVASNAPAPSAAHST